ncbi:hypothetical protein AB6A40_003934 [Gnathostoma spinigerum]|uniref:BHLH domain-containing protein n=1 Tax=Gnathostoma spinigerum TaxID=75299 RepID=A0ABD6EB08_9BILA
MPTYNPPKTMTSPYPSPSPPPFPTERKLKKPLMEKRRRARMNECLDQLKQLLLNIAPHQRSKLEKADILEMTVAYLSQFHLKNPEHMPKTINDPTVYRHYYNEGFMMAASASLSYLNSVLTSSLISPQLQQLHLGLVQHLQSIISSSSTTAVPYNCVNDLNGVYMPSSSVFPTCPSVPQSHQNLILHHTSNHQRFRRSNTQLLSDYSPKRMFHSSSNEENVCTSTVSQIRSPMSDDSTSNESSPSPSFHKNVSNTFPKFPGLTTTSSKVWRPF